MAKSIGNFIATMRKANGYTQEALAEILGVSNKTISSWENDNSSPDLDMLPILAELFHITCDELLKGERVLNPIKEETKETSLKVKNNILKKNILKYKNMTYISIGIFLGFLFLFIPGIIFIKSVFGVVLFIISLCVYVAGIVFSIISYNQIIEKLPEEENYSKYNRSILKNVTFIKCLYSFFLFSFLFCYQANKELKNNPKYELSQKELENLRFNFRLKRILSFIFLGVLLVCFTIYAVLKWTPITYPKMTKEEALDYLYTFSFEQDEEDLKYQLGNTSFSIPIPKKYSDLTIEGKYKFDIFMGKENEKEYRKDFTEGIFTISYQEDSCKICIEDFEILCLEEGVTENKTIYYSYKDTRRIGSFVNSFYEKRSGTSTYSFFSIFLIGFGFLLLVLIIEGIYFGKKKKIL